MVEKLDNTIETLNKGFKELKETFEQNEEKRDALLEEKMSKIDKAMETAEDAIDKAAIAQKLAEQHASLDDKGDKESDSQLELKEAVTAYMKKGDETQFKALSVNEDADGGYLVTPEMDGVIKTRIFEQSPMMALATVQSISSDSLELILDNEESDSGWVGETAARPETNTPQLDKKTIFAHEIYARPKATQKLLDDSFVDVEAWLGDNVSRVFARKANEAFIDGNGVSRPSGLLRSTSTSDTDSAVQVFDTAASGTLAADDVVGLVDRLKDEYAANASWLMNRTTRRLVRLFKDSQGQYLWEPSMQIGTPNQLMGAPVYNAPDMPDVASSALSIAFGDIAQAYRIVERAGTRVLRDPYSVKPFVEFYTTKRIGGDVVNYDAVKVLRIQA